MPNPNRLNKHGKDSEDSQAPSSNLWVGNLSSDVTDKDLMELFAKYGALDSLTSYSSRSYAFVLFKRVEDAKAAKEELQGTNFKGCTIRIEFAKPAKPCRQLWVGGISPSVAKEELEEEFLKFGKVEDFKFFRERNTACVEFAKLEDASQALKSMNGKRIGGDHIRVDFLRSLSSRREQWHEFQDRDGQFFSRTMGTPDAPWMPPDSFGNFSEHVHSGMKRQHFSQSPMGRKGDGQPSNILWVGFPPSVQIDEQKLHNAMILFGEIERIKSFPSRHYSFVEFRSVEEARSAKEGLQGRLFGDPRISIMFSSSDLAPGKDYPGFYPVSKGQRPEFYNEPPFPPGQVDIFGNRPVVPNSFPGPLQSSGILGPMRPFGPQASYEPLLSGSEYNDLAALHSQENSLNSSIRPNWRRQSPSASGTLHSPVLGARPSIRPTSGGWDVYDSAQSQREPKRSRLDTLPLKDDNDPGLGIGQSYGTGFDSDERVPAFYGSLQGKERISPLGTRATSRGSIMGRNNTDFIWRGTIAKGGTPVCHARCVPIGKGIESELPEVVNCSARTGLDMLTKHYAEAVGFDIVFFLPDSEHDFASYTEFLRYLGSKNRAGVAKLDDGTTLFLVPPSDFLTKVLNVAGPERLYGVVLKLPQPAPSVASTQQPSHQPLPLSQYMDRRNVPISQTEYGLVPQKEEGVLQMEYNRVTKEEPGLPSKSHFPRSGEPLPVHSASQDYASINGAKTSQSGVTLTPELIATLASLLPAKSSALESSQGSSSLRSSFQSSGMPDTGTWSQGWKYDQQSSEQTGHLPQHLGIQFHPQPQLGAQVQTYPSVSNTPSHSAQQAIGSSGVQDRTFSLPQLGTVISRPPNTFGLPSQSGQPAAPHYANSQYEVEAPHNAHKGYGMDASGLYGSTDFQRSKDSGNQANNGNFSQPQTLMQPAFEKANPELPKQVQQLQSVLSGADQGSSEVEVDKNQRYQSTLQFAASLLLQIQQQQQQQQQQTGSQTGQGSGNQQ